MKDGHRIVKIAKQINQVEIDKEVSVLSGAPVCKKTKKFLVVGAISKFDGHIFTFNFKNKNTPCIRSFFQEKEISDDILNCEYGGVLGTVAGIIGTIQANEILKKILNIGKNLNGYILILDLLNLSFRKVKLKKLKISK